MSGTLTKVFSASALSCFIAPAVLANDKMVNEIINQPLSVLSCPTGLVCNVAKHTAEESKALRLVQEEQTKREFFQPPKKATKNLTFSGYASSNYLEQDDFLGAQNYRINSSKVIEDFTGAKLPENLRVARLNLRKIELRLEWRFDAYGLIAKSKK